MNQTLHIIRKDVRRLRWPLVAWVTILACGVLLMTAGSSVRGDDAVQSMVATIWGLTVFVEVLMLGLLVSWIVHDEPLVGRDAFWLTRPIRPNDLLVAKLLLTAGVLVILPLLGHTAALRWLGADARELALAAPSYVVTQALAVLLLLAVAVLTPSLTRFVFAIAGCITAFVVIEVIIGVVSQFRARNQIAVYAGPYAPPDLTSSVVLPLLAIGVALAVVVYQYRRRWMSRAIVIAVAGALAAVEVSDVWPWRFAREIEPGPGSWADDAARTAAVLDTTSPFDVSDGWSRRPSSTPQKRVAARVDLAGAPPEYAFTVGGIRTRLVFPDGASLQSAQNDNVAVHRPPRDSTAPLRALLGRARLATIAAGDSDTVPVILAVTKTDYERYGRQAGSLTATVDFHLSRFREIGALPLADGAMLRDQMDRFEVLRVVRRSDGCDVTIRQFNLNALWAARAHRHLYFVLRNAGRGQATDGDQEWMPLGTMNGFGLFGVTVDANSAGLSVSSLVVHFPGTRPKAGDQPRMDQTWLDGADLLVIESVPAGWITRTLTVDGFRMQP